MTCPSTKKMTIYADDTNIRVETGSLDIPVVTLNNATGLSTRVPAIVN